MSNEAGVIYLDSASTSFPKPDIHMGTIRRSTRREISLECRQVRNHPSKKS